MVLVVNGISSAVKNRHVMNFIYGMPIFFIMMTFDEYMIYKGGRCPSCSSYEIEGSQELDFDGVQVYQEIVCKVCGLHWLDIYQLAGFECVSQKSLNFDSSNEITEKTQKTAIKNAVLAS